jgi:hypothetical protein
MLHGHLIPGENVAWIDTLDGTHKKMWRQQTHTRSRELEGFSDDAQSTEAEAVIWLPPRDSNPDMLIQSQISPAENKGNKDLHSAKCTQTRQNPHTGRTRKDEAQS